ncbi:hypothetical protein N3K66_006004 [Trichothecium roseum]|uniref:Uncharacterized protein n=1 Tax=Trichothecium roseum TaxID=47278 RepID=A0ACC0UZG1_9HYPO|nr:hypothetical protein N3K66_006004 [Trichothecium roseum]
MSLLGSINSFSFPYLDYGTGFWGRPTVTLNFCEEDYALSYYCAELCNTITNALFLWLGIKGIANCLSHGHDFIFLLAYIGYMVVGTGSTAFHMTLKYPMQLVDELSMIYTTCLMLYASFSFSRSRTFSSILGVSLLALAGGFTAYYHTTKDPVFHQNAYALLTATVIFRSMWVMEYRLRPALRSRVNDQYTTQLLCTMWAMVATGLTVFLGGFLVWNLDNWYCAEARRFRRTIGLPWALLFEGHAWWHLMTGLGAYYYIVWGIWLRRCLSGQDPNFVLDWPSLFTSVPQLKSIVPTQSNSNGLQSTIRIDEACSRPKTKDE